MRVRALPYRRSSRRSSRWPWQIFSYLFQSFDIFTYFCILSSSPSSAVVAAVWGQVYLGRWKRWAAQIFYAIIETGPIERNSQNALTMFVTKFFFSPTHYCFKMFGFKLGVLGEKRRQWQCWDWCKPHPAQVNTLLIIIITLLLTFVVVSSLSYSCLPSLWSIITFFLAILFSVTILIFILKTETCLFSTFDLPCVLSCSATSQQTQGYRHRHHSYIIKARVPVVHFEFWPSSK